MASPSGKMPKCFGTELFAKWNMTGMRIEEMKIDSPDRQQMCYECDAFERCYQANNIKLSRIKR
jgi:hypothetical protein